MTREASGWEDKVRHIAVFIARSADPVAFVQIEWTERTGIDVRRKGRRGKPKAGQGKALPQLPRIGVKIKIRSLLARSRPGIGVSSHSARMLRCGKKGSRRVGENLGLKFPGGVTVTVCLS